MSMDRQPRRLQRKLAGLLKCKKFLPDGLRKIDDLKLTLVEEVVLTALVDNPHQIVFGRTRTGQYTIDLTKNERGLIAGVLQTDREVG